MWVCTLVESRVASKGRPYSEREMDHLLDDRRLVVVGLVLHCVDLQDEVEGPNVVSSLG